jgi:2-iminobutanoate/2-iminopropanoate deaminase
MKKIETAHAPKAIGPYSQAVQAGSFVFVSGQIAMNPNTGKIEALTIEAQTEQVLQNLSAILEAANCSFQNVVKVEIYLQNMDDFQTVNEIYAKAFKGPVLPARQAVEVARLPRDALVEISCIACKAV